MELELLRTFQRQVELQCEFMVLAAKDIDDAISREQTVRAFYAFQNCLNAAANISKALWGPKGSHAAERKALRDSIGVSDASPFSDVNMRDNFAHMDERLDRWWGESTRHNHVDRNIGPQDFMKAFDDIDIFWAFDPSTGEIVLWGESFNLNALMAEVERVLPVVHAEADKPQSQPKHPHEQGASV